ncbi:RNA-dependent RNA polymerase [Agave yellow streak virus Jalisco 1]|uniref:RNA-dependent RNA polymerase n=1 Tax=Agave yellow streak virus Jalisco 1 TaxID=3142681 RepID=A0A1X9ZMU6_9VIRU|nr:RNA-dependent RNA polymerase [Agave tequilana leaf virus]ARS73022.1 RNA-dependent RNA polymerase [Agave tequilana leaf virus]
MSLGASTSRVARANLYSSLGDKVESIKTVKAARLAVEEENADGRFDYYVSDEAYDFLSSRGIPLSLHCHRVHPHPISKMIENHILFNVFRNLARSRNTFVSLKESKLVSCKLNKSKFTSLDNVNNVYNRLIHAKDALRYQNPIREIDFSASRHLGPELVGSDIVFVHDEVHYWSLSDFQQFLTFCSTPVVYSIIYPAEIQLGYEISLNPTLYKFKLNKDGVSFTWYPDGAQSGAYVQPLNNWLLSTYKTIDGRSRSWTISKLESIGAHHVFLATPGSLVTEMEYTYADYTLLCPKKFRSATNRNPVIRAELARKTAHYLMALKKPDAASAVSKLRQLTKSDETPEEVMFLGNLANTVSKSKYFQTDGTFLLGKALARSFKRACGKWFTYLTDKEEFNRWSLESSLMALKTPELTISRVFRDYIIPPHQRPLKEIDEAIDLIFKGDKTSWVMRGDIIIPDREPQSYCTTEVVERRTRCVGTQVRKLEVYLRALLSYEVKEAFKSKTYYCEGVPLGLFHKSYVCVGKNLFRTTPLLQTKRPIDLYKEGLISLEEYEFRMLDLPPCPTSRVEPKQDQPGTPSTEENFSFGSVEPEEDADWLKGAETIMNLKNTCMIKPVVKAMGIGADMVLSLCNSVEPNFTRYLSSKGLSICGFLRMVEILKLQVYMQRFDYEVSINGERSALGIKIEGEHATECPYKDVGFNVSNLLQMSQAYGTTKIKLNSAHARLLANSFCKNFTGVLLKEHKDVLAELEDFEKEVEVGCFFGFAGSGKSSYLCHTLRFMKEPCDIVVPRRALMEDWANWIRGTPHKVYTFETYLVKGRKNPSHLIVDEVGLYPPGYFDLVQGLKRPGHIIMLGDPLQTTYYSKDDEVALAENGGCIFKRMVGDAIGIPYLLFSHRIPTKQKIFEMECTAPGEFEIEQVRSLNKNLCTLTFKRFSAEEYQGFTSVMTVGQAQGLSRDEVQIIIDEGSLHCDENTVITAFTRARKKIKMFFTIEKDRVLQVAKSETLKRIIKGKRTTRENLLAHLRTQCPSKFLIIDGEEYIGANTMEEIEERLRGDPLLKSMLLILNAEEMEEEEAENEEAPEFSKTHLPLSERTNEQFASELTAKELREQYEKGVGYTDQINNNFESERYSSPYSRSSIYLHHKSDDDLTFLLSIRKRLRFADYERNKTLYLSQESSGKQIFDVLKRKLGFPEVAPTFSLSEKEMEFTQKRINKSAELLEAHSYRSDPDWPSNILKVFIKNQVCTKMEKRGVEAKAGQTIACFSHAVLCKFGAQLRKTEEEFRSLLPDNILIFSQKNYDDLDEWCKTYFTDFRGTDSDYEAFDRSQDGMILAMEVELLNYFKWPTELIEEYKELKLMMGSSLGDLAVMRFSGEFGTFFFNTVCNMAYTYMRYEIPLEHPVAFAGDDMVAPGLLKVSSVYNEILRKMTLKAKVNYGDKPLFCGWRVSPLGIVKDPNLLLDRWGIAEEKGRLHECMCNYALEASYGYRLSDSLYELNIDLDSYQELVRKIIKIKRKLPTHISSIFSSEQDVVSDGETTE